MKEHVILYYFSATGNTSVIVNRISEYLIHNDFEVIIAPIEDGVLTLSQPHRIIFAFPANSQAIPLFVWKFFKSLPKGGMQKVALLVTLNESTYIMKPLRTLLRRKGYSACLTFSIQMPNNMLMTPIDVMDDKNRLQRAFHQADEFTQRFVSGEDYYHTDFEGSRFVSFLTRRTGLPIFFMRFFFKLSTDKDLCLNCGQCIHGCPVQNIQEGFPPRHKNKCDFCMRCAAQCPEKAIYIIGKEHITIRKTNEN